MHHLGIYDFEADIKVVPGSISGHNTACLHSFVNPCILKLRIFFTTLLYDPAIHSTQLLLY